MADQKRRAGAKGEGAAPEAPASGRDGATTNPGPHADTPFEARTERGEEWEDEGEAKRDVLDDLEGEGNPAARQAPPGR